MKFCISQHVYDIIKAKNPSATIDIPIDFKLILDNLDIKENVSFRGKDSIENHIREMVAKTGSSINSPSTDNKTDSAIKADQAKKAWENRAWKLSAFVDEFGDPTDEKFIHTDAKGTFSNSAVSNEVLYVSIKVTKNNVGVFLHERNWQNPAEKFIGGGVLLLKNSNGNVFEVKMSHEWNQSGGMSVDHTYVNELKSFLKNSLGEIKVVAKDKYSSQYKFTINANGYTSEYNRL